MTLSELITGINTLKESTYTEAQLTGMLNSLEGRIASQVYLLPEGYWPAYTWADDQATELLAPAPYDDIYTLWLWCMIDYYNGETNAYRNAMEMYNAAYASFVRWFAGSYDPAGLSLDERVALYCGGGSWAVAGTEITIVLGALPVTRSEAAAAAVKIRQNGTDMLTYTLASAELSWTEDAITVTIPAASSAALHAGRAYITVHITAADGRELESFPPDTMRIFPAA